MTQAEELANRSETEIVTMKTITDMGGCWDSERKAFVLPDGSYGCFSKHAAYKIDKNGQRSFSHYRFEVITENGN